MAGLEYFAPGRSPHIRRASRTRSRCEVFGVIVMLGASRHADAGTTGRAPQRVRTNPLASRGQPHSAVRVAPDRRGASGTSGMHVVATPDCRLGRDARVRLRAPIDYRAAGGAASPRTAHGAWCAAGARDHGLDTWRSVRPVLRCATRGGVSPVILLYLAPTATRRRPDRALRFEHQVDVALDEADMRADSKARGLFGYGQRDVASAPGRIRTCDLRSRRGRFAGLFGCHSGEIVPSELR